MASELHEALVCLETAREQLHESLRQAHFLLSTTQRTEEAKGHLVAMESFPIDEDTLTPLVSLTHSAPDCRSDVSDHTNDAVAPSWVVSVRKGVQPPAPTAKPDLSVGTDNDGGTIDPLFYVSAVPSSDLRACQAAYQRVVECAVAATNAQSRVWQLAEQLSL